MNSFDKLVKEVREIKDVEASREGFKKIWKAIFDLEKVYIAIHKRKNEEDNEAPLIYFGSLEEYPAYFVFTDKEHFDVMDSIISKEQPEMLVEAYELTIEEFLDFAKHLSMEKMPFVTVNFGVEHTFNSANNMIVPIYRELFQIENPQDREVKEGTEIALAVPQNIESMKNAIEAVKGNYKNVINYVSPIFVRIDNVINFTMVINFKDGVPDNIKKDTMENFHNELNDNTALFHTEVHFTEEERLIPDELSAIVKVNF